MGVAERTSAVDGWVGGKFGRVLRVSRVIADARPGSGRIRIASSCRPSMRDARDVCELIPSLARIVKLTRSLSGLPCLRDCRPRTKRRKCVSCASGSCSLAPGGTSASSQDPNGPLVLSSIERAIATIKGANALLDPVFHAPYLEAVAILEEGLRATPGGRQLLAQREKNRAAGPNVL